MSVRFQRVLFPTDFSELSLEAWPYARAVVEAFGAELHCLHVVDDAYQYWSAMGPESIPIGPPPEELLDAARARMERFRHAHLADLPAAVVTEVVMGRPFVEIIAYARRKEVDLIVLGTHGHGAIAHMLLGSTTEKVVRKSPCPVLTVRGRGQEFHLP